MDQRLHDIELAPEAARALSVIENGGYEAWCVGGYVRDALINRQSNDIDVTTSAPWEVVEKLFIAEGIPVHRTGTAHGTLTVVIDTLPIEITTYRKDGAYSDYRHPDNVTFVTNIDEDLKRRDFTMNAIAYHPKRGIYDPCGGIDDLNAGIIRAIGHPFQRFSEDALRILRACRFASQLGFTIETDTKHAACKGKTIMLNVAQERVTHEFELLLCGDHFHDALLDTFDILTGILPELTPMKGFDQRSPYHIYDVLEHTAYVVSHSPATPLARWSALLHDIGKPAAYFETDGVGHFYGHARISVIIAKGVLERFKKTESFQNDCLTLVKMHDDRIAATPRAVRRALVKLDGDTVLFRQLCDLKLADALSKAPHCTPRINQAYDLHNMLDEVIANDIAYSRKQLAVNGKDLIDAGFKQGPALGKVIDQLLSLVVDEEIANTKEELIQAALTIDKDSLDNIQNK